MSDKNTARLPLFQLKNSYRLSRVNGNEPLVVTTCPAPMASAGRPCGESPAGKVQPRRVAGIRVAPDSICYRPWIRPLVRRAIWSPSWAAGESKRRPEAEAVPGKGKLVPASGSCSVNGTSGSVQNRLGAAEDCRLRDFPISKGIRIGLEVVPPWRMWLPSHSRFPEIRSGSLFGIAISPWINPEGSR